MDACDEMINPQAQIPMCPISAGLYLTPETQTVYGCPGIQQTHSFYLYNYTGSAGTFPISVGVTGNGQASDPGSLTLADGAMDTFDLYVTPDGGASHGDVITVDLGASGNTYSDTATLDKIVDVGWIPTWGTVTSSAPSWAGTGYPCDGCTAQNASGEWVTYIIGDQSGITGFWGYNQDTNAWFNPGSTGTPTDRWAPDWAYDSATNLCYLTGGATTPGGGDIDEAYVFDPVANTFTALPSFTTVRDFHDSGVLTIDGVKYLCIGGGVGAAALDSTQCFNLDTMPGAWEAENANMAAYPVEIWAAADGILMAPTGDQWWVVSGDQADETSDAAWYWDDADNSWHSAGNTGKPRYRLEGDFFDGEFYAFGGQQGGFVDTASVVKYNGSAWVDLPDLPNSRLDNVVGVTPDTIWSVDGYGSVSPDYVDYGQFCPPYEADLSIAKIDDIDPIVAGNTLTYTIDIYNDGPFDADDVVVTDSLPAGVSFVSSSGCTEDPNGVPTCSVGTVPAFGSVQFTVTVTVDAATSGIITNNVSVTSATTPDPDGGNNSASEDTLVNPPSADLSITKIDDIDPIVAGNQLTYTIDVSNAGPQAAENVVVTDTLPAGVSLVSTTGCTEDPGGIPTCSLGTIASGGSAQYTVVVDVLPIAAGTILSNIVSVSADTADPVPANNDTSEDTTVTAAIPVADLSITKIDDIDPILAGNQLTYTIDVSNAGPDDAENVVVTDTLPSGVSFVSSTGCTEPNGVPTCSLGTITAGGSAQYTVVVDVASSTSGIIVNNVSVTSDADDPVGANNVYEENTQVDAPQADLAITKLDSVDPVTAGTPLSYTITVSNAGPQDAENVVVTDILPADVTLVSSSGCMTSGGSSTFTCGLGTIAAGGDASFTLNVDVNPDAMATLTNTVSVTADTSDPDTNNNSITEDTDVIASADLEVNKTDSADPVLAGGTLTYTVTVDNLGPSDAQNVVVTDTLSPDVTFVSTTGCDEDPTGVPTCTLGTIAAGGSAQYTITVTVNNDANVTIWNDVMVSSTTSDPDTMNNMHAESTTVIPLGTAEIGDFVWYDSNMDGIQDVTETGGANVVVNLLSVVKGDKAVIDTTMTDDNGTYLFTGVPAGNYQVEFIPPVDAMITSKDQGGDDTLDSDANATTGRTDTFPLAAAEILETIDCGLILDPLLVELLGFDVTVRNRGAVVAWETASEVDVIGFNLLRQNVLPDGSGGRMNVINESLINNQGSDVNGALYHYIDNTIIPGTTYRYFLQAIQTDGRSNTLGTTEITIRHKR